MKRKQIIALLLASVILLLCLSGCSESDYLLSKSQLDEMLADAKAEGYNEGYEDGCNEIEDKYSNDYDIGYSDGYDRGRSDTVDQYERKVKDAYSDGYNEGVSDFILTNRFWMNANNFNLISNFCFSFHYNLSFYLLIIICYNFILSCLISFVNT